MNELKTLLNEEIQEEIVALKGTAIGSDEYRVTVDGLTKLCDRAIEIKKVEEEQALKAQQIRDEQRDRWIKNGLTAAGIIIPTGLTIWGTLVSINFEKEGTITTMMGRGFIQKMFPKK